MTIFLMVVSSGFKMLDRPQHTIHTFVCGLIDYIFLIITALNQLNMIHKNYLVYYITENKKNHQN